MFSFDTLYQGATVGGPAARLYSPAFFQMISPLSNLQYGWFVALWAAMALAALVWIVRMGPWLGVAIVWIAIVGEIQGGNIHLLMATAIVIGFRYPEAWSFLLLTKVLPGIGVLWFALRGEWRSFGRALIATAMIAAVSAILAPGLWADWIRLLAAHPAATGTFGLPIRLGIAGVLLIWGARTDRRWTVPIVAVLASPLLEVAPSMLVACIPLARRDNAESRANHVTQPAIARASATDSS